MPLSQRELEKLADDQYLDRLITGSVHCGNCGYNLRTLPYVYACPECGQEYNARPLHRRGIFDPREMYFPAGELVVFLICLPLAGVFLWLGYANSDSARWIVGVVFAALAVPFGFNFYYGLLRFIKAHTIHRRIRMEAEDEL